MARKTTLLLIFGVVLLFTIFATAWLRGRKPAPLKLSEETTFFTEPLAEDGSVDYAAALNRHFRRDTQPETNAVILIQRAVGPSEKVPGAYYDKLGMEQLPEEGDYLRKLDREFLSEQGLDAVAIEQHLEFLGHASGVQVPALPETFAEDLAGAVQQFAGDERAWRHEGLALAMLRDITAEADRRLEKLSEAITRAWFSHVAAAQTVGSSAVGSSTA